MLTSPDQPVTLFGGQAMFYTTMKRILLPLFALGILAAYGHASDAAAPGSYYDRSGHADAWSGGAA